MRGDGAGNACGACRDAVRAADGLGRCRTAGGLWGGRGSFPRGRATCSAAGWCETGGSGDIAVAGWLNKARDALMGRENAAECGFPAVHYIPDSRKGKRFPKLVLGGLAENGAKRSCAGKWWGDARREARGGRGRGKGIAVGCRGRIALGRRREEARGCCGCGRAQRNVRGEARGGRGSFCLTWGGVAVLVMEARRRCICGRGRPSHRASGRVPRIFIGEY